LLQWNALTGTTMYDDGMLTEFGINEGTVFEAGIIIVPNVLTTSLEETIYKVSVSITTVTVEAATLGGSTDPSDGCQRDVGT